MGSDGKMEVQFDTLSGSCPGRLEMSEGRMPVMVIYVRLFGPLPVHVEV